MAKIQRNCKHQKCTDTEISSFWFYYTIVTTITSFDKKIIQYNHTREDWQLCGGISALTTAKEIRNIRNAGALRFLHPVNYVSEVGYITLTNFTNKLERHNKQNWCWKTRKSSDHARKGQKPRKSWTIETFRTSISSSSSRFYQSYSHRWQNTHNYHYKMRKSFNHTRERWNPKKSQTPETLRTAFSSNRFLIDYITALVSITSHDKKISCNYTKRSKERPEKNQKKHKEMIFFSFFVWILLKQ